MKKNEVLDLTYMAMYIALALVLDYVSAFIPFLKMPFGGSINLSVIPVFVAGYHLKAKKGILVGFLWWLVGFMMGQNAWYLNLSQYILDYIFPMSIVGACSLIPSTKKISNIYSGIILVTILRYVSTILSGVYYWPPEGSVAGSRAAWIFSIEYNLWYNLATGIVAIIIVPLVIRAIGKRIGYKG